MAPIIIEQIGKHKSYWEPFCGSLAVLLAKEMCSQETANDLHGDLVNLAWVLQGEKSAVTLYARLQRTLMSEPLYLHAVGQCKEPFTPKQDAPDGERAYYYMLNAWMGRNGMAGTIREDSNIAVRWTSGGGSPAGRWKAVVDSVPDWHQRLRNVLILNRDGFEVIAKIEDEVGTAIYVDPPYLMATRKGDRGSGRYKHEFSMEDHERLAGLLQRFTLARVVVSYYESPELDRLYPRWGKLSCHRAKNLSLQQSRGAEAQEAPEVLLMNGSPYGEIKPGEADLFA